MSKEEKGFFSTLQNDFSLTEYKLLFTIAIIFGLVGLGMIGTSLWFKEPLIYCFDQDHATYFKCEEMEACSKVYYIDLFNGPTSLTAQFGLICASSEMKRFSQWIILFGMYFGCLLNMLISVPDRYLQKYVAFCAIFFGIFGLLALFFQNNLIIISICLGIALNFSLIIMTQSMSLLNKIFTQSQAPSVIAVANIMWGSFTIMYSILAFISDSNWKVLIGFGHIIMFILGCYLLVLPVSEMDEKKSEDEEKNEQGESNLKIFKELLGKKKICKNYFIYAFLGVANFFTLTAFPFELESVGGSLYLNMILLSILDTISCVLTGYIGVKFEILEVLKSNNSLLLIFFSFFFFVPAKTDSDMSLFQFITILISLVCMLLYSNSANLSLMANRALLTNRYINISMIFQMFLSRVLVQGLPYINYLFRETLNIHPYIFILIMWILARIMLNSLVIIEKEDENKNEVELDNLKKSLI